MLRNFQLGAIIRRNKQSELRSFSCRESLQNILADEWEKQYETFINDTEETDFVTSYTLDSGELFRICPYNLPDWLANINSENIRNIQEIHINRFPSDSIKSIVAFARDGNNNELMLFQNFTGRQVIQPGRLLVFRDNSYRSIQDKALGLSDKLTAVYLSREEKLLFEKYPSTQRFLPLDDYYYLASNRDIRDLLNHRLFECEDVQNIMTNAKRFQRRRFAMLKSSNILDNISAEDVRRVSIIYDLGIQVRDDKIVFPDEADVAKTLLQLLNEEIYQGALTGTVFQANSKRPYRT